MHRAVHGVQVVSVHDVSLRGMRDAISCAAPSELPVCEPYRTRISSVSEEDDAIVAKGRVCADLRVMKGR